MDYLDYLRGTSHSRPNLSVNPSSTASNPEVLSGEESAYGYLAHDKKVRYSSCSYTGVHSFLLLGFPLTNGTIDGYRKMRLMTTTMPYRQRPRNARPSRWRLLNVCLKVGGSEYPPIVCPTTPS